VLAGGEAQLFVGRVLRAQDLARLYAERRDQLAQLFDGGRGLEDVDATKGGLLLLQEVD